MSFGLAQCVPVECSQPLAAREGKRQRGSSPGPAIGIRAQVRVRVRVVTSTRSGQSLDGVSGLGLGSWLGLSVGVGTWLGLGEGVGPKLQTRAISLVFGRQARQSRLIGAEGFANWAWPQS